MGIRDQRQDIADVPADPGYGTKSLLEQDILPFWPAIPADPVQGAGEARPASSWILRAGHE